METKGTKENNKEVVYVEESSHVIRKISLVVMGRKWIALGAVILLTGALTLGLHYGVSKPKKNYNATFNISLPNANGVYIDGTTYDLMDLAKRKALEETKSTDKAFESIDIDRMLNKNLIKITVVSPKKDDKEQIVFPYSLTISESCFSSDKQGIAFMDALTAYPIRYSNNAYVKNDYMKYLNSTFNYAFFVDQIGSLENQMNYLLGGYNELSSIDNFVINGKTVGDSKREIESYFSNNSLDALKWELTNKGYSENFEAIKNVLELRKVQLGKEKADNIKIIEALKLEIKDLPNSGTGSIQIYETYNKIIGEKIQRNVAIDRELLDIETQLTNGQNPNIEELNAFKAKIKKMHTDLADFTNRFKDVQIAVAADSSTINYSDARRSVVVGGYSIALIGLGSLIVSSFIVITGLCVFDYSKVSKKFDEAEIKIIE